MVMIFQTFANQELLFDEVICTKGNVGLVPNDVKCVVSKLHSWAIPGSALAAHTRLLNTEALGMIVPSVSLTIMPFTLFIPFGYCAVVKYMVKVAGKFLNALPEAVELL
jgi:hypothetical protein